MSSRILSVRGAVSIPEGTDEAAATVDAMGRLFDALAARNDFTPENLVNILFTQTADLRQMNAAAALRRAAPEYGSTPLFCSAEPDIENSPERIIRVLVTWLGSGNAEPVYLDGAAALRPDLTGG